MKIFIWLCRIIVALILVQTLFFKFTAAPESIYIFNAIYAEPIGRIGTGILELIASILVIIPRTTLWGAIIGLGTMSGAILTHLFILPHIAIPNVDANGMVMPGGGSDHGLLFIYALITWICCIILIWHNRYQLIAIIQKNKKQ